MPLNDINNSTLIWGIISAAGLHRIKQEDRIVIVPENRPHMIGLQHNIPLLRKEDVRFAYCTDNMLGLLFYKKKIKKTLLFCKESGDDGIKGISGSLYVTLLSKLHKIPIEIISQDSYDTGYQDMDAASIGGKQFITDEDKEQFVIMPEDELVGWELLK